ncbi:hypothetical protein BT69DRAFT_1306783, partial [Atractiella rhizophila]
YIVENGTLNLRRWRAGSMVTVSSAGSPSPRFGRCGVEHVSYAEAVHGMKREQEEVKYVDRGAQERAEDGEERGRRKRHPWLGCESEEEATVRQLTISLRFSQTLMASIRAEYPRVDVRLSEQRQRKSPGLVMNSFTRTWISIIFSNWVTGSTFFDDEVKRSNQTKNITPEDSGRKHEEPGSRPL